METIQYRGTGRRKKSIAQVRLLPGNGKFTVNGKDIEEYFDYETLRTVAKEPLELTDTEASFDIIVKVVGGGYSGQAGAVRHGVARALLEVDPEYRSVLKKAGFLTRDPRMKERKKYGLKKARRSLYIIFTRALATGLFLLDLTQFAKKFVVGQAEDCL